MKAWTERIDSQGTYTQENHICPCTTNHQGVMQEPKSNESQGALNAIPSLSSYTDKEDGITARPDTPGKKYPSIVKNVKCSGINIIQGEVRQ